MDFPTRTHFTGGVSDGPEHLGTKNSGTERPCDTVQVAFMEDADRAWRTDKESFPAETAMPEHPDLAVTRRLFAAPCTNQREGASA